MDDYEAVLGEVRRSDMMRGIWSSYVSASPYAEGVDFEEAVDSAIELARLSELEFGLTEARSPSPRQYQTIAL